VSARAAALKDSPNFALTLAGEGLAVPTVFRDLHTAPEAFGLLRRLPCSGQEPGAAVALARVRGGSHALARRARQAAFIRTQQ
jgi:hypothetical protein